MESTTGNFHEFEARRRERLSRDEATFRGFLERRAQAFAEDTRYFPERQMRSLSPTLTETSQAESMSSVSSMASMSLTNSTIVSAIAAADGSDLESVLEQMKARHDYRARKLQQYAKVQRSERGSHGAGEVVIDQHEQEQRGDIESVESIWRGNIAQLAAKEPWMALLATCRHESAARRAMAAEERNEIARIAEEHFSTEVVEHFWRVQACVRREKSGGLTASDDATEAPPDDLLAKAFQRMESHARHAFENEEASSRNELARGERRMLNAVAHGMECQTVPGAPIARAFDGHIVDAPSSARLEFARVQLFQRKAVVEADSSERVGIAAVEADHRKKLVYHYQHTVRRHLSLPTSVVS